jgi:hypothetical protein
MKQNNDTTDGEQSETAIEREDIRVTTHDGHPALQVGDATVMLRTQFEGAPPEATEKDHYDEWPFFVLDFDEDYFDGLLEMTPEFVLSEETE